MDMYIKSDKKSFNSDISSPTRGTFGLRRLSGIFKRYLVGRIRGEPYVLNIEVTNACNARCGHCNCWKIKPGRLLSDYSPVVKRFKPIVVWFTGGEPLLREDICEIVASVRSEMQVSYLGLSSNGWLLNKRLGERLQKSGLDQLNISIDFLGPGHDEHRGIKGLFDHIANIIPALKEIGLRVVITTSIMKKNMRMLLDIAGVARQWRVEVGYSCYSSLKTGDKNHIITTEDINDLKQIIHSLLNFKHKHGVIKSSDYYLQKIPEFFEKHAVGKCRATQSWLYLTPDGHLKICPDKNTYSYFEDYSRPLKINCGECWYTCRGEMEVPLAEKLKWVTSGLFFERHRTTI